MAKVADVEIALRAQVSTLQADLGKANRQIEKFSKDTSSKFKLLGDAVQGAFGINLVKLGTIAGVSALGTAFAVATKKAFDFAAEIGDTARNLGISTDALQELRFAAVQSGVAVDQLDTALKFLNKNTSAALSDNTKMADAFNRLGISIRDLQTLTPDKLFGVVLEQLNKLPTAAERTRLSLLLLGKGGGELGKLATETAEGIDILREQARKLGVVLDEKTIKAADAAGDKFDALLTILKIRGVQTLLEFTPLWDSLSEAMLRASQSATEFVASIGANPELRKARDDVAALKATLDDLNANNFLGVLDPQIADVERRLAAANSKLALLQFSTDQLPGITPRDLPGAPPRGLNAPRDSKAAARAELAAQKAAAKEAAALAREAEQMSDRMARSLEAESTTVANLAERRLEAEAELAEALGNTSLAEQKRAEIVEARFERERALIVETVQDAEASQKALEDLAATRDAELSKIAAEGTNDFQEALDALEERFSSVLATMVTEGEFSFQALGQALIREFVEKGISVALKELAKLGGALASSGSTGGTGGFDFLSLFGLASGGLVTKPTIAMIGEAGPEAVIPLSQLGGGGGDVEITINNNGGGQARLAGQRRTNGRTELLFEIDAAMSDLTARGGSKFVKTLQQNFGLTRRGERNG